MLLINGGFAVEVDLTVPLFLARVTAALAFSASVIFISRLGWKQNDIRIREKYIYGLYSFQNISEFRNGKIMLLLTLLGLAISNLDVLLQQGIRNVNISKTDGSRLNRLSIPTSNIPIISLDLLSTGTIDFTPLCSLSSCRGTEHKIKGIENGNSATVPFNVTDFQINLPAVQLSVTTKLNLTAFPMNGKSRYYYATRLGLAGQFLLSEYSNLLLKSDLIWYFGRNFNSREIDETLLTDPRLVLEGNGTVFGTVLASQTQNNELVDDSTLIYFSHSQLISRFDNNTSRFRDICFSKLKNSNAVDAKYILAEIPELVEMGFGSENGNQGALVFYDEQDFESVELFVSGYQMRCIVRRLWMDYGNTDLKKLAVPQRIRSSLSFSEALYITPLAAKQNPSMVNLPNITIYNPVLTGSLGGNFDLTEDIFSRWCSISRSLFANGGNEVFLDTTVPMTFVAYWVAFFMIMVLLLFTIAFFSRRRINKYFLMPTSAVLIEAAGDLDPGSVEKKISISEEDKKPLLSVGDQSILFDSKEDKLEDSPTIAVINHAI